ncbi:MAG: SMI1/KNR4 family protein [Lachnospiraceae bacterium]|nr:SMI1/KNR4 family protein [Lachnospiraceae bacterium]
MLISRFDNTNIEEHIIRLEKQYNIVLPEEYKRFLQKYNGGETPNTKFRINKVSSDVRAFYGLGNADKYYNFQKLIDNMNILEDYIEDDMLPIATTDYGDVITVGIGKEENGSIFFKYHDRGKKYIKLTDNLCEFASKCKSEKLGYIETIEERKQGMIADGLGRRITESLIEAWQEEIDEYAHIHQEEFEL